MLLPRTAGAKTNLPMCLRRCESSSLGRFAERVLTCLDLSAAEVPCRTAPFASFSGRTEKGGPARPERIPIFSSIVRVIKKASLTGKFYEMINNIPFSTVRRRAYVYTAAGDRVLLAFHSVVDWMLETGVVSGLLSPASHPACSVMVVPKSERRIWNGKCCGIDSSPEASLLQI